MMRSCGASSYFCPFWCSSASKKPDEDVLEIKPTMITNPLVLDIINAWEKKPLQAHASKDKGLTEPRIVRREIGTYTYQGCLKNDKPEGYGIVYLPDDEYFEGEFREGRANGEGRIAFKSGEYFEGNFKDNQASGEGYFKGNHLTFRGKWLQSTPIQGYFYLPNGKIVKLDSQSSGTIQWPNGDYYSGSIRELMPGGNGVMTFANKNRYEGGWQNGTFEGEGTFTWADGRVYVGHYSLGLKTGYGEMRFSQNQTYKGEWRHGKPNGQGKVTEHGKVREGYFNNGILSLEPQITLPVIPKPNETLLALYNSTVDRNMDIMQEIASPVHRSM